MLKNKFVFIPNTLDIIKGEKQQGYLEGFYEQFDDCDCYYVINNKITPHKSTACIGYTGDGFRQLLDCKLNNKSVHIDNKTGKVTIINAADNKYCLVPIYYDYKVFKRSKVLHLHCNDYGDHFRRLIDNLRVVEPDNNYYNSRINVITVVLLYILRILDFMLLFFNKISIYTSYSATISHFKQNLDAIHWFLRELVVKKQHIKSTKMVNVLTTKTLDLAIGITLIKYCLDHEQTILCVIEDAREIIIKNLKELLTCLMGSPIGLKLNCALNQSLGTFFFYHISLWRAFLYSMQPLLVQYLRYFVVPTGLFGFSFQVAMLSDLIAIVTFHVYCIYVYAARLFYFQLRGLISLWRLFIGRKYNPLRDRVDSYQYSQHQLFIGTLGFTVLLFLLPTTVLYYAVFTILRVGILIIDAILSQIRHIMTCLPVYLVILWIIKSPTLAGSLYLEWKIKPKQGDVNVINARLNTLSLSTIIKEFLPDIIVDGNPQLSNNNNNNNNNLLWSQLFHRIVVGILI